MVEHQFSTPYNRRLVAYIAGALVLLALLVPPWIVDVGPVVSKKGVSAVSGYRVSAGWHPVFMTLRGNPGETVAIDWARLGLELLVIGVATGLAIYALSDTLTTAPIQNE